MSTHDIDADFLAMGIDVSPEARSILLRMCEANPLRLIVPIGDVGIFLIGDPRLQDTRRVEVTESKPVIELIRKKLIGQLPEQSPDWRKGQGGKIGWRDMFKGHEAIIPEGAQVYVRMQ